MNLVIQSNQEIPAWEILKEELTTFFMNLPKNTHDAYKNDLTKFFYFLKLKSIHPLEVKQIHIEWFMKFISERGGIGGRPAADRTYNRKLATIKAFYGYLGEKRILESDPTSFVRFRKMTLRVETADLPSVKVKELFELIPRDNLKHLRDRAILGVLFYTGCRRAEVRDLNFDDLKQIRGIKVLRFKVKGGGIREAPVSSELLKLLNSYLEAAKEEGIELKEDFPLFFSIQHRSRLDPSSINLIFDRWTRKLHLSYDVSPHSARATLIGMLYENGVNIREQAQTVNHSDINMTNAYNKRKKQLEESPLLKISLK